MESYCFLERVERSSQDKKAATRCGVRRAPPTPHCLSAAALRSCYCQPGIKHMHPHQPQPHQQPLTCVARPVLQPEKPSAATAAATGTVHAKTRHVTAVLRFIPVSFDFVTVERGPRSRRRSLRRRGAT